MFCFFRWIHRDGVNPDGFASKGNAASIAEKVSNVISVLSFEAFDTHVTRSCSYSLHFVVKVTKTIS